MPPAPAPLDPASDPRDHRPVETRLHGRWHLGARVVWWVVLALALVLYVGLIPATVADAHLLCLNAACRDSGRLTPDKAQELSQLGLSLDFYALFVLGVTRLVDVGYLAIGVLLFWRKSDDRMALLASCALVTFGAASTHVAPATPIPLWLALLLRWLAFFGSSCFAGCLCVFPSGQFVPCWTRWLLVLWVAYWGWNDLLFYAFTSTTGLNNALFYGLFFSLVILQVYRYRRISTPVQRQQTKWVVYGLTLAFVGFFLSVLALHTVPIGIIAYLVATGCLFLFLLLIPLSIGMAILRSHLWDIDIIINRTLVYAALTASVVGCYILVVGYLGALLRTSGNLLISLIATGLVAVLFQPLRGWLQRGVNRLMYGLRDEPYAVVARLGRRLESTLAPEAVLSAIVETVAQALKLPYAAITLKQGEDFTTAAAYGALVEGTLTLPLSYQAEPVGQLLLGPRQRGEAFTPTDRRLLDDLARQVGIATHAVRLTSDLQRSREQLVTSREEERRRLRRDLHDGLGSTLTSLLFKLDATDTLLECDTAAARALLEEVRSQMQASISDIRRLVYNLRPPTLDEWGLVATLREQVTHYALNNVQVTIDAPESLSPLSAAVEVASYRIVLEALANVIKHAQATTCVIRLALLEDALTVEVQDNGAGRSTGSHVGVGLIAMRERAAELGGTCVVEDVSPQGTRVFARIPLRKA